MARPKDDADNLSKNRQERRELLEGLSPGDFEEISEVTQPNFHVHLPAPRSPAPPPALPPPRTALPSANDVLERLPPHHRLWAVLAVVAAILAAVLAGKLVLGSGSAEPVKTPAIAK